MEEPIDGTFRENVKLCSSVWIVIFFVLISRDPNFLVTAASTLRSFSFGCLIVKPPKLAAIQFDCETSLASRNWPTLIATPSLWLKCDIILEFQMQYQTVTYFPSNSPSKTPTLSRILPWAIVLTGSQRARESLGRRVSLADNNSWTKRSAARPLTDDSGIRVTVEEISLPSVLNTTTHGRVLGTSAPRARSRLTHTREPPTTKASFPYPRRRIRGYCGAILAAGNDTPRLIAS
jgi:hypothetical protein